MLSALTCDYKGLLPMAHAFCEGADSTPYDVFLCDALSSDFQEPQWCDEAIDSLKLAAASDTQEDIWVGNAYSLEYSGGRVLFENVLTNESGFSASVQEVIFALRSWRTFLADRQPATFVLEAGTSDEP